MANDLREYLSSLVGGRVADQIMTLIREHIKSAVQPEPRYISDHDEEIRDNYVAGFVSGRYQERQAILSILGNKEENTNGRL
jgi:hypothetical protein